MKSKKILLILAVISLVFLTGCFDTTTDGETPPENTYVTGDFSIHLPEQWETFGKEDFVSEIPKDTEIVIRNNVKNEEFTANVSVTKNILPAPMSSTDYAKNGFESLKNSMFNFREIKRETIKIKIDGQEAETLYLAFEGKRNENENLIQFLQAYGVKGNIGYIATGAFSPNEDELTVKKIDEMIRSFEVK